MSVLPWRHPLFGWTACCMPPDHCVGILHLHHHHYCLCFDHCAHCHCLLSHSHPHCSLRHHCSLCHHRSLHHHCSLHHHQMKGCHPRFLLLAHLEGHVPGLRGDLSLPLSEIHALESAAAWPSPVLAALAVSETPAVELVDAAAVRAAMVLTPRQPDLGPSPMVLAPPRGLKGGVSPSKGSVSPGLEAVLGTGSLPDAGSCPSINGSSPWRPTSGVSFGCGVSLLFPPLLGLLWLGVFLWFWCLPRLCLLGFLPGRRSHGFTLSPHQALVLSVFFVVVQGLPVRPGLLPAWYPRQGRLCASGLPSCVPLRVQLVPHPSHLRRCTGAWLFGG